MPSRDRDAGDPAVLAGQVKRMLRDPKAFALVEDFGGQWLQFRNIDAVRPDLELSRFRRRVTAGNAARDGTVPGQHIPKTDGSLLDLLDANYTFLNEREDKRRAGLMPKGPVKNLLNKKLREMEVILEVVGALPENQPFRCRVEGVARLMKESRLARQKSGTESSRNSPPASKIAGSMKRRQAALSIKLPMGNKAT